MTTEERRKEILKMHESKIEYITNTIHDIMNNPEVIKEAREVRKQSRYLSPEELHRPFTI